MEYLAERISTDAAICGGNPIIRGKRITVQTVLEYLEEGENREQILFQYPSLDNDDIDACIAFSENLKTNNNKPI